MAKFSPGDVVQLSSGGPDMTILNRSSAEPAPDGMFKCAWFAGQEVKEAHFPAGALRLVSRADSTAADTA